MQLAILVAVLQSVRTVSPSVTPAASVANGPQVIVCKDGQRYKATGPYQIRGAQAVFTLTNGQLVSMRADAIDPVATRNANLVLHTPPTPSASPRPKSRITLTESDIPAVPTANPDTVTGTLQAFGGHGPQVTALFRLTQGLIVFRLRHSGDRN